MFETENGVKDRHVEIDFWKQSSEMTDAEVVYFGRKSTPAKK